MKIQRKVITAFWAATMMSSAMVACMPVQEGAQVPEGETVEGAQAGADKGAAAGVGAAGSGGATAGAPQPKESTAPPPPKEQECRSRAFYPAPTNGAPAGDTKQQFDQLFDAQHEAFRCCFDAIDAPKRPLSGGKVTLLVKVDGAGKLKSSGLVAAESDAVSPEMNKCINDVASLLTYPKPAASLSVGYKRSFDFKPRR